MKITELIAQHILEVHEGNNWTESDIKTTLQHLTFWNREMVQRIKGMGGPIPESNGFHVPPLFTEEEWQHLKDDNLMSAHELAIAVRNFDESTLELPILPGYSSAYKNLQGSAEHIHYHLGQMVILKQLIRAK